MDSLGRITLHDPRSRDFVDTRLSRRAPSPGYSVRHAMNAPHVDQFYTGGCVGFSGTNALNCAAAVRSRQRWSQVFGSHTRSARYLGNDAGIENYTGATENDPYDWVYPPTDGGSSVIGLMKYWRKYGIITRYDWTFTFDAFLAALQHQPVLVGTNWFDDMMSTDTDGIVKSSASGDGGGHEYLATEIIWSKKLLGYEQSWGQHPPGFGKAGRFWMSFELAEELIINQGGDVAVPTFS